MWKKEKNKIYIVGAHSRAQTLAVYLSYLISDIKIEAFLVNNEEAHADSINNIPVRQFTKDTILYKDYPVFIGTRNVYHSKLILDLQHIGMQHIIPVTVELDSRLRNAYIQQVFKLEGRNFQKIDDIAIDETSRQRKKKLTGHIYVAKSIYDNELQFSYMLAPYEVPIQVGAALTTKRLKDTVLTDCKGNNISEKNRQYCELTALYWIWKHAEEDIVGLAHYRRHFLLPSDWLERMESNHIDVILPIPLYVAPSLSENFRERHEASAWDYLMRYLRENSAGEFAEAEKFFQGNLYSPCNMFIARREVLDQLCTWLFPILHEVVIHCGLREDYYQNRYPGFISERLISFFFEKYQKEYNIVYANKNFLT